MRFAFVPLMLGPLFHMKTDREQGLVYLQKILQNKNSSIFFVFDKYCQIMD